MIVFILFPLPQTQYLPMPLNPLCCVTPIPYFKQSRYELQTLGSKTVTLFPLNSISLVVTPQRYFNLHDTDSVSLTHLTLDYKFVMSLFFQWD